MRSANFEQTPSRAPRRLLSASVLRKLGTVLSDDGAPEVLTSSLISCCLSSAERVGACRMVFSFGSLVNVLCSESKAFAVGSRVFVLTAAVYYNRS